MKLRELVVLALTGASMSSVLAATPGVRPHAAPRPQALDAASARADEVLVRTRGLLDEARQAQERGDNAAARAAAGEAIDLLLAQPESADDTERTARLFSLAVVAHETGDQAAAEAAWRRVLAFRARTLPDDHLELQTARLNLALSLKARGAPDEAHPLEMQALDALLRSVPEDHPELVRAQVNLAGTIKELGDLRGALALEEQALAVLERSLPAEHPNVQRLRKNLAGTLYQLGELPRARALLEELLVVQERALPADDSNLQGTRQNLAAVLAEFGELERARTLFEQVLAARARTLPQDHHDLQRARINLASILGLLDELQAARVLEEQLIEALSRSLPAEHLDLQRTRLNLAATIKSGGDLQGARALEEQVLEVLARTLPDDNPELQRARRNLTATLQELGEHQRARALAEHVLAIDAASLPDDHPRLQESRALLADALWIVGDLHGARMLQEQVLEVVARMLPEHDLRVQAAREHLALTLYALDDLAGAQSIQEHVLAVDAATLPEDHQDLQRARLNLAATLGLRCARAASGADPAAPDVQARFLELIQALVQASTRIAREAVLSSSSREAEQRSSYLANRLAIALSVAAGYGPIGANPELARAAFVMSETTRGSALSSARLARLARADARYAGICSELRAAGAELARLAQSGADRTAYDALVARRDRAQLELVRIASRSGDAESILAEPTPERLTEQLSEHDALVTYRRFTRWQVPADVLEERAAEHLCAFVLRKEAELQLVDLGPIESIEAAARGWRDAIGATAGRGGKVERADGDDTTADRQAARLAELVLTPLGASLKGTRRIVFVLDDILHAVPLDALPVHALGAVSAATQGTTGGDLLGDRYEIEVRSTTQELLGGSASPAGEPLVLLVGGPDYFATPALYTDDPVPAARSTDTDRPDAPVVASLLRGGPWSEGFTPLPETSAEARGLELLSQQGGEPRTVIRLEGDRASRGSIELLAPRARVLHLATHGWFAPESIRSWSDPDPIEGRGGWSERMSAEERIKGSSPMLLCGLALAGANLPADAVGRYPGLVTAEEISGWDLSSCELAVLSACDTNVGERVAGQGVASLQKALHMAGARTVITSLWKVPDEATKELMLDFYRRIWVEKTPKAQALWAAKMRLRDARDERGAARYTTRDWAAWVLTGEPR